MSKSLLHIEGLIVLLVPDISMLGYLINNLTDSSIYNFGHTYVIPLILIILSVILHRDLMLALSIIWVAHIGMDRTIVYGLKYPSNVKDTHIQKV
jgi:Domain of unknown function (DUF4260)